jgi:hypothetical protein
MNESIFIYSIIKELHQKLKNDDVGWSKKKRFI